MGGIMNQITIEWPGKKENKLTISLSDDLLQVLNVIARETDKPISTIAGEYVAKCASDDFGKLMILQARGKVSLNMATL